MTPDAGGARCPNHPDVPASSTCSRCGTFVCGACFAATGTTECGACAALRGPARVPPPWERRSELGLVRAAIETWKESLFSPEVFFSRLPAEGSVGEPLLYTWLLTLVQVLPAYLVQVLSFGQMHEVLQKAFRGNVPAWILELSPWAWAALATLPTLLMVPLSFIIGAGLTHLGCLLWGAAGKGFDATARVVGYAQGPIVAAWVPYVGAFAWLYVLVLEAWGIARVHEVSVPRAVGGVLTFPVLFLCCGCAAVVALTVALASGLR